MNGPQDMGGMMGFGPVVPEDENVRFHPAWERRAFAVSLAMGATGSWTIDQSRHAREKIPPAKYWSSNYYEIWLAGLERLMAERGMATREEIEAGKSMHQPKPIPRVLQGTMVATVLAKGAPYDRPTASVARFRIGQRVTTSRAVQDGHTRLPSYARGRNGIITAVHGCHVYPDTSAHGDKAIAHWLYAVTFTATELWGRDSRDTVTLDLFEPYLDVVK